MLARLFYKFCVSVEKRATYLCARAMVRRPSRTRCGCALAFSGAPPPRLAIDIGGNVGEYSAELLRLHSGLELHTFEPSSSNITKLRERFADNPLVRIEQSVLSDSAGRMTLYADRDGSGLASLTKRQLEHFDIRFDPIEEVEVRRFEDYWRQHLAGRTLDIVKIDVEGHELMVLRGFGEAIRKVRVVQFEFGGTNIDTKVFFRDLWLFFEGAGFDLYRITPLGVMRIERYHERDELFIISNFIAVNRAPRLLDDASEMLRASA